MSKNKKIIIGVVVGVIALILVGLAAFFALKNHKKTPISADEFYKTCSNKGYEMVDSVDQYDSIFGEGVVEESYIALGENHQIEFLDFADADDAVRVYKGEEEYLETLKGSGSASTSVSFNSYSKCTLTSNGKYHCVSRIEDTMIYIDIDEDYKDEVKETVKELGY